MLLLLILKSVRNHETLTAVCWPLGKWGLATKNGLRVFQVCVKKPVTGISLQHINLQINFFHLDPANAVETSRARTTAVHVFERRPLGVRFSVRFDDHVAGRNDGRPPLSFNLQNHLWGLQPLVQEKPRSGMIKHLERQNATRGNTMNNDLMLLGCSPISTLDRSETKRDFSSALDLGTDMISCCPAIYIYYRFRDGFGRARFD